VIQSEPKPRSFTPKPERFCVGAAGVPRLLSVVVGHPCWPYRLARAVGRWSALYLAAVALASASAQDVRPNFVYPAATFGTNEQQQLDERQSTIAQSLFDRKYLLGDWKGERATLEEKGVTFDFY
jgi:hypothetical protein